MYILKKKLKPACMAHYLGKDFPKACKNLHGHNYDFHIEVGFNKLNEYDMGIDFAEIKETCDNFIQEHFDHKTLFSSFQTDAIDFWNKMGWSYTVWGDENTTAETMAKYLAILFYNRFLANNLPVMYVIMAVKETEGSEAVYICDENTKEEIGELQSK